MRLGNSGTARALHRKFRKTCRLPDSFLCSEDKNFPVNISFRGLRMAVSQTENRLSDHSAGYEKVLEDIFRNTRASDTTEDVSRSYDAAADNRRPSEWVMEIKRAVREKGLCDTGLEVKTLPASYSANKRLFRMSTKRTGSSGYLTRTKRQVSAGITRESR